jgi:hypothetical protein
MSRFNTKSALGRIGKMRGKREGDVVVLAEGLVIMHQDALKQCMYLVH